MSTERTFRELNKPAELYSMCSRLSQSLADDLEAEQIVVRHVASDLLSLSELWCSLCYANLKDETPL